MSFVDTSNYLQSNNHGEIDASLVKMRATSGLLILSVRRILAQVILTVGNIILARLLFPEIIGSFTVLNFYITFFCVISDVGLGQAIVQAKKQPTLADLRSVFTVHIFLSLFSFIILYLAAPFLVFIYGSQLQDSSVFFMRFLSISLFFINLRKVSSFILERELRFVELSIAEVIELFCIQFLTIFLAIKGFGLQSYIYGTVLGRFIGMVLFYLLSPWPVGISLTFKPIQRFLKFGLSFQLNTLIGFINGALAPLYIGLYPGPGGYSGVEAVGYISWAGGIALTTQAMSEVVQRIVFPTVSRFQDNLETMRSVVRRSIFLTCFLSFPLIGVFVGLAVPFTVIVYTSKWLPGVWALVVLLLHSALTILWTVITPVFFGLGLSRQVRNINIVWTGLQWILTIPLVMKYGFVGFAWAQLVSSVIIIYPLGYISKKIGISIKKEIFPYLALASFSGLFVYSYHRILGVGSLWELMNLAIVGLFVYLGLAYVLLKKHLIEHLQKAQAIVFTNLRRK
jgi:O-antigen/teichoic acid export membrane protein